MVNLTAYKLLSIVRIYTVRHSETLDRPAVAGHDPVRRLILIDTDPSHKPCRIIDEHHCVQLLSLSSGCLWQDKEVLNVCLPQIIAMLALKSAHCASRALCAGIERLELMGSITPARQMIL